MRLNQIWCHYRIMSQATPNFFQSIYVNFNYITVSSQMKKLTYNNRAS